MSRRLVYGKGRATVEFSDMQRTAFESALRAAAPATMKAINAELDRVEAFATAHAPVKSGKFKRSIGTQIKIQGTDVTGTVQATVPYAWHVRWGLKSFGFRLGGRVVEDIIFRPGMKGVDRLAAAIADDLQSAAVKGN